MRCKSCNKIMSTFKQKKSVLIKDNDYQEESVLKNEQEDLCHECLSACTRAWSFADDKDYHHDELTNYKKSIDDL